MAKNVLGHTWKPLQISFYQDFPLISFRVAINSKIPSRQLIFHYLVAIVSPVYLPQCVDDSNFPGYCWWIGGAVCISHAMIAFWCSKSPVLVELCICCFDQYVPSHSPLFDMILFSVDLSGLTTKPTYWQRFMESLFFEWSLGSACQSTLHLCINLHLFR